MYGKSHSSWGVPGMYGRGENIELHKNSNHDFIITRHFTTTASVGNSGKSYYVDTSEVSTKSYKRVPIDKIRLWLTQLNTNKEYFTTAFIKNKLTIPTKKEIFKVAKKYDKLWMLSGRDADKAHTKKALFEIQSFYELDSFLLFFKETTVVNEMTVIDSYNRLNIMTINGSDTTEYWCQFFEPLGQPIMRFNNKNYSMGIKVFNLEANTSAQDFLPRNSIISKVLDIDNIKETYIKWYLDKKM